MKKEFHKLAGDLSKVALVVAGILFSASSFATMANKTQGLQDVVPAQGRATLTVEDLQTLLGIRTRDPSSKGLNQQQEVSDSAATFHMSLSSKEKKRIALEIEKLTLKRAQLKNELEEMKAAEVNSLREKRRQIQMSRTRSGKDDVRLGRQLFNSLLAESNAQASIDRELSQFDQDHAIVIQYVSNKDGLRSVAAIKMGSQFVWQGSALPSGRMMARNHR